MRKLTLALLIYATDMFTPPYPPCGVSVTDAAAKVATFSRSESPQVSPEQVITGDISRNIFSAKFVKPTGSHFVNRRKKRKRIKPVVHRKPPTVIVLPDVIRVMSAAEVEAERRAREAVKWVTWF